MSPLVISKILLSHVFIVLISVLHKSCHELCLCRVYIHFCSQFLGASTLEILWGLCHHLTSLGDFRPQTPFMSLLSKFLANPVRSFL